MPNFGFNPFAPRINVFTTGVDAGDSRRYYSRDVIRVGRERVEINATLTPGEPGRKHQTLFEKEIKDLVKKERDYASKKDRRIQFVPGETIQSKENNHSDVMTYTEVVSLKKENERRTELSRYNLTDDEVEQVIEFEKKLDDSISKDSNNHQKEFSSIPASLQRIYAKIELSHQKLEEDTKSNTAQKRDLSIDMDRDIDDFLTLQRLKNTELGYTNSLLKIAESGVVDSTFRPMNFRDTMKILDKEMMKQHPEWFDHLNDTTKTEDTVESFNQTKHSSKRLKIADSDFLNVNTPLETEKYSESTPNDIRPLYHITDDEIQTNHMSDEEWQKLPQSKTYCEGQTNKTLFIRNLPKDITKEQLIELFSRYDKNYTIEYTLLTGRMKGQAFVCFQNTENALTALRKLHRFIFQGKPLIVEFKKQK